jgi:hypothetical protein
MSESAPKRKKTKRELFIHKIRTNLTKRIKRLIGKQPPGRYKELMGVQAYKEILDHLIKNFQPGMTMDNYGDKHGQWNLDHIKPCRAFDLNNPNEQKKCFHYTNIQPMWAKDNNEKGASYVDKERFVTYSKHGLMSSNPLRKLSSKALAVLKSGLEKVGLIFTWQKD